MKGVASVLIVIALFATPTVLGQDPANKGQHWGMPASVSGILTMRIHFRDRLLPGNNRTVLVPNEANQMTFANKSDDPFTYYALTTADGTGVMIERPVAEAAPVKLDDYLNASVTLVGTGWETCTTNGNRIIIEKITSIARNAAAAQPAVRAQNSADESYCDNWPRTNILMAGFLTAHTRTEVEVHETNKVNGTYLRMHVSDGIDTMADTNTVYRRYVVYTVTAPDGSMVDFGSRVANTAPVKVSDYVNEFVTMEVTGPVLPGRAGGRVGNGIIVDKITMLTKNAAVAKHESTNLTVSGTLTRGIGAYGNATGTVTSDKRYTVYSLTTTDGTKIFIEGQVADTSPVKLSGYLNQSVTIAGTGWESGRVNHKSIHIEKITSITKNAAQPAAGRP